MRKEIREAAQIIKNGGVIIYPTETVCGMGCDARNFQSIDRIFQIKKRPQSKSLLTLFSSEDMIYRYFKEVPDAAWDIFEFATKPTTLILDNPMGLAENVIANDNTTAARLVKSGPAYELINFLNVPLVSTSVNLSGEAPVVHTENTPSFIRDQVDYVLSEAEGEFGTGIPSSIIRIRPNGGFQIIRK